MTQLEYEHKVQQIKEATIERKASLVKELTKVSNEWNELKKELNRLQQLVVEKRSEHNALENQLRTINYDEYERRIALRREYELSNDEKK